MNGSSDKSYLVLVHMPVTVVMLFSCTVTPRVNFDCKISAFRDTNELGLGET